MPSIRDLWPDRWLRASHLCGKRPTVTIETVAVESLFNPRTKRNEPKLIIGFHKKTLRLVLNKTQAMSLADITHTDNYEAWIGHQVVLSTGRAPNGSDTILISPIPDPPPAVPSINSSAPAAEAPAEETGDDLFDK